MTSPSNHIGLLFGSFNPIHQGHLKIAEHMLTHEGLDNIWFVVSPCNPLKQKELLANPWQRFEMVRLAVASNPKFKVSDIEFNMPEPSYTCDTLHLLAYIYSKFRFSLIIGSDNLKEFHLWKNHEEILSNFQILVYTRIGAEPSPFDAHHNVRFTEAPLLEISSTQIRQYISDKKEFRHLLPKQVYNYIVSNRLYSHG